MMKKSHRLLYSLAGIILSLSICCLSSCSVHKRNSDKVQQKIQSDKLTDDFSSKKLEALEIDSREGDVEATELLIRYYTFLSDTDETKKVESLVKRAAKQGHPTYQATHAKSMLDSRETADHGIHLLETYSLEGNAQAAYYLYLLYKTGNEFVTPNNELALQWKKIFNKLKHDKNWSVPGVFSNHN